MSEKFKIKSDYKPIEAQEEAIGSIIGNIKNKVSRQTLLGVTGSGKTFVVANALERLQMPTLLVTHNKTLAAQNYQELRDFFPENAVSYFVSYYDYYQPEAYIPQTDTYIEKDADINELIDKLRLAATTNILTRKDVIVVASVSCIYNIGSPKEYGNFVFEFARGVAVNRSQVIDRLVDLQYERSDFGFHRGTFRVRGDLIDVHPAYLDDAIKIEFNDNKISHILMINPLTGVVKEELEAYILYPAKHFMTDPRKNKEIIQTIRQDLGAQIEKFKKEGKELEAHRLKQKISYELEMIEEVGYVKGIENYSRYFDGRKPGEAPFTLIDYFQEAYGDNWLFVADESHMTFPQIRGMHGGDLSRKTTLIDYGFRLPSAFDNRPLTFTEFERRIPKLLAISATPGEWELSQSEKNITELLVRPTGIPDPKVEIRPTENQVSDVMEEVKKRAQKKQKCLITTLTKRTAEDLSEFMKGADMNVHYLHSDINTLDRTDTLDDLRSGKYDALIGINLLREGLDLPEVSLVAILDADKEGFLRSDVSLIQTMGRAARHIEGSVIMYADRITGSMQRALDEVRRRREYQIEMNKKYGIEPKQIFKPIREKLVNREIAEEDQWVDDLEQGTYSALGEIDYEGLTPMDRKKLARNLKREMRIAANDLNFELAIKIREIVKKLEK